ncbi:putative membrane protein [Zhouia amylolytica]|nr:DUF368 domain-containing protein [Zhouia amylolytica]MCQ0111379.1 DUF368 domain-containing protein [Zhouia amylolytica]SFS49460.1 putative membrane protein [Zhouia amylolytica]
MRRSFLDYLIITLKGIAMGAADVVPGVSGGTIAFISGIYEELISSINKINLSALKTLRKEGIAKTWEQINGNFFAALLLGIAISVLSLAKGIKWLLENEPILLWSFFFGLVLASILFVAKEIKRWQLSTISFFIIGTIVAYYITTIPPMQNTESNLFLFLAGALAICAMILPGISGAFILVLLGAYKVVLEAIDEKNLKTIGILGIGAIFGILSFARILKWMFNHYKNLTLAILTGFILGSLNKIWPWKETLTWYTNSKGHEVPLLQQSILPGNYTGDPQLLWSVLLAICGFLTIYILERVAVKSN